MSGSQAFEIQANDGFLQSVKALIREHYGKKNRKGEDEFRAELEAILASLCRQVRPLRSRPEPWPRTGDTSAYAETFEFCKLEFTPPRLAGAASCGRLMYLIDRTAGLVWPVTVYTHGQFPGRPSDKSLDELITAVINHRPLPDP